MVPSVPMWTPSAPELILIVLVIVMLFGAKKLPELARGSGRALRIFKAETRGLADDEDETTQPAQRVEEPPRPLTAGEPAPPHQVATSSEDSTQRPTER